MGTLTSLEALYDNIARANGNPDAAQVRAEAERYTTTVTGTFSDLDVFYTFFDNAFPGSPSARRFTKAERAQRRQVSSRMRKALTNYASTYASTRNVPGTEPWLQCLLFPTVQQDEEIYAEANQERMAQFLPDSPAGQQYKQRTIEGIRRKNPEMSLEEATAQAEQALPKLRGDIVEHYVKEAAQVMEKLDRLAGPDVPLDDLAMNLGRIMGAKRINDSIEKYLELADSGLIQLSQETRDLMQRQKELRPRLTLATSKLEAMANPMYEYFDPEQLGAYDMVAMEKVWEEFRANEDPAWRAAMGRKHAHFSSYATEGVYDNFTSFLQNAAEYGAAKRELTRRQVRDTLTAYSFEPRLATKYSEVPSTHDPADKVKEMRKQGATHTLDGIANLNLYNDKPTVYVQGFRVIVTSPADTFSGITVERPETLYNYSLSGTAATLSKTLEDADRWYKTNKHGYEDMRRHLQEVMNLGKLSKDFTDQDMEKRKALYSALLKSSRQYLDSKGNGAGKNDVERKRINAAHSVRDFATIKFRELELIAAAKATLARYQDVPPEELHATTTRENSSQEMKANIQALDQTSRREHPVEWLQDLYSPRFLAQAQLPEPLTRQLTQHLTMLKQKWDQKTILQNNITSDCFELSLGTTAAAEMILAERTRLGGTGGPVEARLARATKDELISLGTEVFRKQLNHAPLNTESVNNVLRSFDPRVEPNQYAPAFLKPAVLRQELTARYLSTIQPTGSQERDQTFRDYVSAHILDSADQNFQKLSGPLQKAQTILANCVLHDVILLERSGNQGQGPGSIEQQMREAPDLLTEKIQTSPKFQQRMTELAQRGLSPAQVLVGGEIKQFATEYIAHHNASLQADRDKLLQNQKGPEMKAPEIKGQVEKAPAVNGQNPPKNEAQKGGPIV